MNRYCINMVDAYFRVLILFLVLRISKPETDCKPSARGEDYRGYTSQTSTGKTCQHWNVHVPHAHTMGPRLPGGATKNVNYCRNPHSWKYPHAPWCYTTWVNVTWEYCAIPLCANPHPVASWIFDEQHGGTDTSFLRENPVTMGNLTYSSGLNGEPNVAIVLPADPSQRMVIQSPTYALRFKHELSFITYIYITGSAGTIMQYNNWNGDAYSRLSIYVEKDSTTLKTSLISGSYTIHHQALNVLSQGWVKLGISISAYGVRTYLNGSLVNQSPNTWNQQTLDKYTGNGDIFFGSIPGKDNRTVGRMACAKFFDVTLSDLLMASVDCSNKACRELENGLCVGNCLGFNVGESCERYIDILPVRESSISTVVLNVQSIKVSWKILTAPKQGTRNYYQFVVMHRQKYVGDFEYSPTIYIGEEDVSTHVYEYIIENLKKDEDYEISIRSERIVGGSKDHIDTEIITVKTPCVAPETPTGLFVTREDDKFVVTWTSNLEALDSGCSTKIVSLYYKYTDSDPWHTIRISFSLLNYTFDVRGYDDCFVKMVVVNNVGDMSETVVITVGNATLPRTTPISVNDDSTLVQQSSTTEQSESEMLDMQTGKGLSQISIILAVCLAFVGVIMIIFIIVATVCWRYLSEYKKQSISLKSQVQNLKGQLATHQVYQTANRKSEYAPYLEPVSSSNDMYQEIAEKDGARRSRPRQYESLDPANGD